MLLDDRQIEHYSRQIVLAEVGAVGQARLLHSRVAIAGDGQAAERVLGYLAAAGIGTIAAPLALHAAADPASPDLTLLALETSSTDKAARDASGALFDAVVAVGTVADTLPKARHAFWIAGGRVGETPPCAACAGAALGEPTGSRPDALGDLRDALLGTIVATEVIKAILGIGTGLRGRVLVAGADGANVEVVAVASRPSCPVCRAAGAED